MSLTREEIIAGIAKRQLLVEQMEVSEWGGTVYFKLLSVEELKKIGFFSGLDKFELPVRLLVACLSDERGTALFTKTDFKAIAGADFATTVRVFEKAAAFNGLGDDEVDEAAADFVEAQDGDGSSS